jgi:hypothetical protein
MFDVVVVALVGVDGPPVVADEALFAVEIWGGFRHEVLLVVVGLRGGGLADVVGEGAAAGGLDARVWSGGEGPVGGCVVGAPVRGFRRRHVGVLVINEREERWPSFQRRVEGVV